MKYLIIQENLTSGEFEATYTVDVAESGDLRQWIINHLITDNYLAYRSILLDKGCHAVREILRTYASKYNGASRAIAINKIPSSAFGDMPVVTLAYEINSFVNMPDVNVTTITNTGSITDDRIAFPHLVGKFCEDDGSDSNPKEHWPELWESPEGVDGWGDLFMEMISEVYVMINGEICTIVQTPKGIKAYSTEQYDSLNDIQSEHFFDWILR